MCIWFNKQILFLNYVQLSPMGSRVGYWRDEAKVREECLLDNSLYILSFEPCEYMCTLLLLIYITKY
jgi:hypothetical protein